MTMRFGRKRKAGQPVVREVPIRGDGIRLGQFLKLADLIDSGADAKPLLAEGVVFVNGELETRRGRQLVKGDVVTLADEAVRVV
jgi:ribosome-associated protein